MTKTDKKSIVLFDGVCNLCCTSVQFILKHDKKKKFVFASLQSDVAQTKLLQLKHKNTDLNSIVLITNNKVFFKSTAALKVAKELDLLWSLLYGFIIIPKVLRDYIYDIIAKNRYKWFGKKDVCFTPNDSHKKRFVNI